MKKDTKIVYIGEDRGYDEILRFRSKFTYMIDEDNEVWVLVEDILGYLNVYTQDMDTYLDQSYYSIGNIDVMKVTRDHTSLVDRVGWKQVLWNANRQHPDKLFIPIASLYKFTPILEASNKDAILDSFIAREVELQEGGLPSVPDDHIGNALLRAEAITRISAPTISRGPSYYEATGLSWKIKVNDLTGEIQDVSIHPDIPTEDSDLVLEYLSTYSKSLSPDYPSKLTYKEFILFLMSEPQHYKVVDYGDVNLWVTYSDYDNGIEGHGLVISTETEGGLKAENTFHDIDKYRNLYEKAKILAYTPLEERGDFSDFIIEEEKYVYNRLLSKYVPEYALTKVDVLNNGDIEVALVDPRKATRFTKKEIENVEKNHHGINFTIMDNDNWEIDDSCVGYRFTLKD